MAKVEYVTLIPAESELYYSGLTAQDRFTFPRVTRKVALYSKKKVKGLTQKSLLPQISEIWATFTDEQKLAWSNAGAECGLNGWRLFVQDMCVRIKNEMSGSATPDLLHQSFVGNIRIDEPDSQVKIVQYHPRSYWITKKVPGKKGMYEPVLVTEDFSLPLEISLNYSSDLEAVEEGAFAKFYALVWHSYQGADLFEEVPVNLDLVSGWKTDSANLTSLIGYVVGYTLYFHLFGVRGNLYFDNVKAEHSGQNWVRDTFCKDINQQFTKAFYQIPKHWGPIVLPSNSWYDSMYKDF
jgi:hypothetical protein